MAKTLTLKTPITFGQETITELTFQHMKARHLRGTGTGDLDAEAILLIASKLSGQPLKVIDDLSIQDYQQVVKVVSSFFAPGLATGEPDSQLSPAS